MKRSQKQTSQPSKVDTTLSVQVNDTSAALTRDFVNSLLIVSVLINLAVFIGWLALQVTTQYDAEVFGLLFNR